MADLTILCLVLFAILAALGLVVFTLIYGAVLAALEEFEKRKRAWK